MANPLSGRRRRLTIAISVITVSWVIALAGCANRPAAPHTALGDLPAEYAGTLPCGDCSGIAYRLTLGRDQRYVLHQHYDSDRPTADLIETGRWAIANHGQRLTLTPADSDYAVQSRWRIDGQRGLTALGDDGQTIAPPAQYRLERGDTPADRRLAGVRWQLTNAPEEAMARTAYIRFDSEHSRLVGSTGCNRLAAGYHRDHGRLHLSRLATTRRDCPGGMDTEQSLTAALRQTRRFAVLGRYLLLFGAAQDPAPLAVFRAAR